MRTNNVKGRPIVIGKNARVMVIPEWLSHDLPEDEVVEIRLCERALKEVIEVDEHGYVWFGSNVQSCWFCLKPEEIEVE